MSISFVKGSEGEEDNVVDHVGVAVNVFGGRGGTDGGEGGTLRGGQVDQKTGDGRAGEEENGNSGSFSFDSTSNVIADQILRMKTYVM